MKYPIRINHYLAEKNYSTRRGGDTLISAKKVLINGKVAKLGDKVNAKDKVEVQGENTTKNYVYYAYNKPLGIVTTNPALGEKSIIENAKFPTTVFPIGRLDKDSRGLILLTNDGRITNKLLNPKFNHEKEYRVVVNHPLIDSFLRKMRDGVTIGSEKASKCKVRRISKDTIDVILTEGKNRQIRRMCRSLNYDVRDLNRLRVMNVLLGDLKPNKFRAIEGPELTTLLKNLGL